MAPRRPSYWDDHEYLLKATGFHALTEPERRQLDHLTDRFPVLG